MTDTRLMVVQHNDDDRSGEWREVLPAVPGETSRQTLERKAASHAAHGWTVTRTPDGFHAYKDYEPGGWVGRKMRVFRIVQD